MNIHIIAAALPPQVDGIGDYSAHLAAELARSASVTLLTSQGRPHDPISGVSIEPTFSAQKPSTVGRIVQAVEADRPDWVLLQYNPFSYGRWGLNPHLPGAMRRIKRRCPGTKFALMVHEPFVPVLDWKHAIMTVWQRQQLRALGQAADVIAFSVAPWAARFRRWFPGKPVLHLPVGSNIPLVPTTSGEARARLGISEGQCVLGFFGTAHNARLLDWVRDAARAVARAGRDPLVLYMGPHKDVMGRVLDGTPIIADGLLSAEETSGRFPAVDVFLAPFVDGVSTRRTSVMAALQHGLAVVGTRGALTDDVLVRQDGKSFLLADVSAPDEFQRHVLRLLNDKELRERLGHEARGLFETLFSWNVIGSQWMTALSPTSE